MSQYDDLLAKYGVQPAEQNGEDEYDALLKKYSGDVQADKPKDTRGIADIYQDVSLGMFEGMQNVQSGIGGLWGLATGDMDNRKLRVAKDLAKQARAAMSSYQQKKDKSAQLSVEKAEKEGGFWSGLGEGIMQGLDDPMMAISRQLPLLAAGGISGGATKLAAGQFIKQATEKTLIELGAAGSVASMAAMQGSDIGADAYERVLAIKPDTWAKNVDFQALIKQGESEDAAKHAIALREGRIAAAKAAAISIASQKLPGGSTLEKVMMGAGGKGGIAGMGIGALKGAAGESLQESIEEGGGQKFSNEAVQAVDPTQSSMQGVGGAAGQGAAVAAILGGTAGGVSGFTPSDTQAAHPAGASPSSIPPAAAGTSPLSAPPPLNQANPGASVFPDVNESIQADELVQADAANPVDMVDPQPAPPVDVAPTAAPLDTATASMDEVRRQNEQRIQRMIDLAASRGDFEPVKTLPTGTPVVGNRAVSSIPSGRIAQVLDATTNPNERIALEQEMARRGMEVPVSVEPAPSVQESAVLPKDNELPAEPATARGDVSFREQKETKTGFDETDSTKPDEVSAFDQRYPTIAAAEQAIKAKKLKQVAVFKDGDQYRIGARGDKKQAPSNNLIQRIKQLGGIHTRYRAYVIGDKAGAPGLFSNTGKGLDDLATALQAEGFAIDTAEAGGGVDALTELIQRAVNNGETILNYAGQQAAAEKKIAEEFRDNLKEEIAKLGGNPARNASTQKLVDMLNSLRAQLRADLEQESIAKAAQLEAIIGKELPPAEWDMLLDERNAQAFDYTQDIAAIARMEQEREAAHAVEREYEREGAQTAGQRAGEGPRQGDSTGGGEPQAARTEAGQEDFGLTGETPEEIRAREEAQAAKAKAEQEAADKAEAEAKKKRIDAEVASRQQASAENFVLGQGAEDALAGQGDIFGQPVKPGTTTHARKAPESAAGKPAVSQNTVFTEDAAAAARARLKAKLGRLNTGLDPETMLDGITLAGYHIEKGARTFAAYAKAMIEDLGDAVKPYLKSWYAAVSNVKRPNEGETNKPNDTKFSRSIRTGDFLLIENPTRDQAENLLRRSKHQSMRGLRDPETGKLYIWDANDAIHHQVARELGITDDVYERLEFDDVGALRKGVFSGEPGYGGVITDRPSAYEVREIRMSRKGGAAKGISLRDLNAMVDRVRKSMDNLPTVHVLTSPMALDLNNPSQARLREFIEQAGALEDVEGATHEGEIYLFASGLADEARAEHVLATHEVTHYGLRAVFGMDLDPVLQSIWATNANIRKRATALREKLGLASNVAAVEEILADMEPAELLKLTGWRRLAQVVRDWFRGHGFTALADRIDSLLKAGLDGQRQADLLVADVVNAARGWVKGGKRGGKVASGTALQRVWHGTPHVWGPEPGFPHGRPRLDKIGTGEGRQAYGFGWYSAESRGVAWSYQKALADRKYKATLDGAEFFPKDVWENSMLGVLSRGDIDQLSRWEKGLLESIAYQEGRKATADAETQDFIRTRIEQDDRYLGLVRAALSGRLKDAVEVYSGSLYQLDIPDDVLPYLLDWDKPLSEQTPEVRKALENDIITMKHRAYTGEAYYNELAKTRFADEFGRKDRKAASEYLASIGIVGNRYLDGQSRNRPLKDIKREFLAELPEDADASEVAELIGTGKFSPKNDALLRALKNDDWLGFDYPAQAVSTALSNDLSGYDASPELIRAVADAKEGGTYNFVIWDQPTLDKIALLERNGEKLDAMREADAQFSRKLADDLPAQEKWLNTEARMRGFQNIEDLAAKDYKVFENLAKLWREKYEENPDGATAGRATDAPTDAAASLTRDGTVAGLDSSITKLSRAGQSKLPGVQQSVADRANAIIADATTKFRPIEAIVKAGVQLIRFDRATSALYAKAGHLLDVWTPEKVKAGVVADYGIPGSVLDQRAMMAGRKRVQLRKSEQLIEKLATLTRAESRVAYEWLNNDDAQAAAYFEAQLPAESVQVLNDVRAMIDGLSQEAVRLGQLDAETFKRHRFAYLRRSYAKHVEEMTKRDLAKRQRAIAIMGDQYKGRGITDATTMKQVQNIAPEWWKRKTQAGKADKSLKGERFIRLEKRANTGAGTVPLAGMTGRPQGKILAVAYWPAGEPIPARLKDWNENGTWEVRDIKADKLVLWRDFTKAERVTMGEIDEARFAIARTLHGMINDIETGRYLNWLADKYGEIDPSRVTGPVVDASERMRDTFAADEWVKVPETKIPATNVLKYGKLAGRFLPGPIWNDVRQVVSGRFQPLGETYAAILSAWKTSKTALSPAVHTNNVMANMVMADWHDVGAGHMLKALRILLAAGDRDGKGILGNIGNAASRAGVSDREAAREILNRFMDSGGGIGTWITQEIQKEQMLPLLEALENELRLTGQTQANQIGVMAALQHLLRLRFPEAWEAFKGSKPGKPIVQEARNLIALYESEDQVFRLAAWLKAKEEGINDLEAGKAARKSFLDYHINAPWIQAMRQSAFPFIAFTYRAMPMLLDTAAHKPWKLMKLALVAGALNALGYALSGGDEDDERKPLPDEKAGSVWGLVPKLIRMPWNDKNGAPVFLDIRRFVPVGDIFDTGQTHTAIPVAPAMIPGGPLALLGELALNKQQFTGKAITLDTDTGMEKAGKVADHLYKAFAPNLVILPGTYAWTGVSDSLKGKTDSFGREMTPAMSMATAFGVKLGAYPTDQLRLNAMRAAQAKTMEIDRNIQVLKRQLATRGITPEDFQEKVQDQQEKKRKVLEGLREKTQ